MRDVAGGGVDHYYLLEELYSVAGMADRDNPPFRGSDLLDNWPGDRLSGWLQTVNRPQNDRELDRVRECVRRGRPYGDEA